jgi:hypothetical protein
VVDERGESIESTKSQAVALSQLYDIARRTALDIDRKVKSLKEALDKL